MGFNIDLRPSVLEDLDEACTWYERQRAGLGGALTEAFFAALRTIEREPTIHAFCYRDFRHVLLKRFPYAIYFRVSDQNIVVYRFHHGARSDRKLHTSLRTLHP